MLRNIYKRLRESSNKIAKELLITIPIIAGGDYTMYVWHVNSMALGFIWSFLVFMSVQWYFSDGATRENMIVRSIQLCHKFGTDIVLWMGLIAILCVFEPNKTLIHNHYVLTTFSSVESLGFLVVMFIPLYTFIENLSSSVGYQMRSMMSRLLAAFAFYRLSLFFISYYGDAVYTDVTQHTSESLQTVVILVIIGLILRMTMGVAKKQSFDHREKNSGYSYGLQVVNDADVGFAAAHECGHAIMFAALGADNIPSDLTVHIKKSADKDGVLASVEHAIRPNAFGPVVLTEKLYAEWDMLTLLAGKVAESLIMHSSTLGAVNDNTKWLVTASAYLANHYNGMMYYPKPANQFEQAVNNESLSNFRIEQLKMLNEFMMLNIDVLHDMYNALREKKSLGAYDLATFFSRVRFPEGFPSLNTANH